MALRGVRHLPFFPGVCGMNDGDLGGEVVCAGTALEELEGEESEEEEDDEEGDEEGDDDDEDEEEDSDDDGEPGAAPTAGKEQECKQQ